VVLPLVRMEVAGAGEGRKERRMKILDLFAGEGGELRRAQIEALGHEYDTLDIDPRFGCTFTQDIMKLNDLGLYDFVWASVPCETFSVASFGHHWNKNGTPKTDKARYMIALVQHTIKLLNETARIGWVIENPRGLLRKIPFMRGIRRHTVTYCQYGETRMKPTDIWVCGFNWTPRPMCRRGDPCHEAAPRGSKTGTQGMKDYTAKSVVPFELWKEILEAAGGIQRLTWTPQTAMFAAAPVGRDR
jgi:hypothetical protein